MPWSGTETPEMPKVRHSHTREQPKGIRTNRKQEEVCRIRQVCDMHKKPSFFMLFTNNLATKFAGRFKWSIRSWYRKDYRRNSKIIGALFFLSEYGNYLCTQNEGFLCNIIPYLSIYCAKKHFSSAHFSKKNFSPSFSGSYLFFPKFFRKVLYRIYRFSGK